MPLAFLLDENLPRSIWNAIQRHNEEGQEFLDVTRVGEIAELPLGTDDGSILLWSEQHNRLLITQDKRTMPGHLTDYLDSGGHSPGIFMLRTGITTSHFIEYLVLVAYASESMEWRDRIEYIA
jgi:hypothetical protein